MAQITKDMIIADIIAVLFTSVLFTFQFKKALAQIRNSNKM